MAEIWGKKAAMEFSSTSNGRRLWRPRHNLSSNSVGGVCVKSQLCHAISLPNPNPIYNKVYPLVFHPFISCFQYIKPLLFKRSPFAFQNESFYSPKGVLLQSKTNPFTRQKESFCKTIGLHP